jgi:hypothetical protein
LSALTSSLCSQKRSQKRRNCSHEVRARPQSPWKKHAAPRVLALAGHGFAARKLLQPQRLHQRVACHDVAVIDLCDHVVG